MVGRGHFRDLRLSLVRGAFPARSAMKLQAWNKERVGLAGFGFLPGEKKELREGQRS